MDSTDISGSHKNEIVPPRPLTSHFDGRRRRRIAIVGSFSTGKTTLGNELARLLDLPLLPEVARQIVELGFKLDKDATPETETLIFLRQWHAETTHPEFVGDRSLIDVMAYASWVLENQEFRKEHYLWEACLDIASQNLRSQYSHVLYLPIEFPIVPDGLRPEDPEFQKDIDARILDILHTYDVQYYRVTGSVDERVRQSLEIIENFG